MPAWIRILAIAGLFSPLAYAQDTDYQLPCSIGEFNQQIHRPSTTAQGLPDNDVNQIAVDPQGRILANTAKGTARFDGERWQQTPMEASAFAVPALEGEQKTALDRYAGAAVKIFGVAKSQNQIAVAADSGLYLYNQHEWRLALPRQGLLQWAPLEVRAVLYDAAGKLWFAAPQGVGYRISEQEWKLFTGQDGLPFNDFTCMAAGPQGIWFGATNGAIHYQDGRWEFRQGGRWLLDNNVRDIAVDRQGNAWIATGRGISCIENHPMTLPQKAAYYEEEIEKRHRRTRFGYVDPAQLSIPGDKSTAVPVFTDNDGHFTGLYLGAVSLGFAATGRDKLKQDADNAFRALAFLSEVTQGGTHPAPKGFIARAVLPTSEPDPNTQFDLAYDQRRNAADALWKIIQPRWPIDASGQWYWKNDSSSDELDGHFFGYAIYFDRVCKTETEKDAVRQVIRPIIDHILDHGYNLVDYDGTPTRWGRFSPDDMNRNSDWHDERGLNSLSILTYLAIAHHVTGDPKYREAYLELALGHGYAMNGMTQPKSIPGPNDPGHQPDDNMAFMNYYHLLRYETDPKLLNMFQYAIQTHYQYEKLERNPFANFIYAACCLGKTRRDQWGEADLSPPKTCFDDSIDTLKRYPIDLLDWPMSNTHRIDLQPVQGGRGGGGRDGKVLPIDERHETYWDMNPWALEGNGNGTRLREGVPYLLAYYMAKAHGFISD